MTATTEATISIAEAAKRLRLSYFATHDLLLRGELEGYRQGRAWRILESSVVGVEQVPRSQSGRRSSQR
jgi:excisionase family DNA binding protein